MFKISIKIITLLLAVAVSACAYPVTTVEQGSGDASIYFVGAPEGAIAYVDGLSVGVASDYNGSDQVLGVIPGRHHIQVMQSGETLVDQEIYVGAETRTPIAVQ